MKLADVQIGKVVYFKKYALTFHDPEIPFLVKSIEKRNGKHNRVVLDTGLKVNSGELTDVKCSEMTCNNCKYH